MRFLGSKCSVTASAAIAPPQASPGELKHSPDLLASWQGRKRGNGEMEREGERGEGKEHSLLLTHTAPKSKIMYKSLVVVAAAAAAAVL